MENCKKCLKLQADKVTQICAECHSQENLPVSGTGNGTGQESEAWEKQLDLLPSDEGGYAIERMHPTDRDKLKSFIRTLLAKEREEAELKAGGYLMSAFRAGQLELLGKIKLEEFRNQDAHENIDDYFRRKEGYKKATQALEALKIKIKESL